MQRRQFLKTAAPVLLLCANSKLLFGSAGWMADNSKKSILRFAVASDGHYGQPETTYDQSFLELVKHINNEHARRPLDYCVINGDIIHDEPSLLQPAKDQISRLEMPFGVTQGNHDLVSEDEWSHIWGMSVNHHYSIKDQAFLMAKTSNQKGEYVCPDLSWMAKRLEEYKDAQNIFIFLHITPVKWTTYGIDCPDFVELLKRHRNVRAVFNGHDHDQDDVKISEGVPYLFSAHFGGNWGTAYRGFRMVEVLKDNTVATYMLNPGNRINERRFEMNKAQVRGND
jgi:hypothetical protein